MLVLGVPVQPQINNMTLRNQTGGFLGVTSVDNSQLGNNAATRLISMLYNHSLA